MYEFELDQTARRLREAGIRLGRGLRAGQIAQAEAFYGVQFPPDLAALLAAFRVPTLYDWGDFTGDTVCRIRRALRQPIDGILFDVEENGFWLEQWGIRPASVAEARTVAEAALADVPPLIPLYRHRYLPGVPCQAGNPVYSVWQTDLIVYGRDLWTYLAAEFCGERPNMIRAETLPGVPFWGGLLG